MTTRKNNGREAFGFDVETNSTDAGYSRSKEKYAGNQWSGVQNPNKDFNEGTGPRRGNQDYRGVGGPSATKDKFREPLHTSEASGREYPKNPDAIRFGKQERNPSGTRAVDFPKNIDRINIEAKGTQGMGRSQSTNPIAIAKRGGNPDGINYGPKSQY